MKKVIKSLKLTLLPLLLVTTAHASPFDNGHWIDLTHTFDENSVYWPTADSFKKHTVFEGKTDKGYYYSAYNFEAAEHGGTHLDSPVHFYQGRKSVEQVTLEQLIGKAVVINIAKQAQENRDYQLSVDDILAFEKKHGKIAKESILLINTDSAKYYNDRKKYMGTDMRGEKAVKHLSFPGISPEAARFIVTQRKIKAVGLDTPSLDYGKSTHFESHVILFKHNIPGFENVANLNALPPTGATVIALPMKIKGGSGGPLRIIAFVPKLAM